MSVPTILNFSLGLMLCLRKYKSLSKRIDKLCLCRFLTFVLNLYRLKMCILDHFSLYRLFLVLGRFETKGID